MTLPYDPATDLQDYAHPERLVTQEWIDAHRDDPALVLLESNGAIEPDAPRAIMPVRARARSSESSRVEPGRFHSAGREERIGDSFDLGRERERLG